MCHLWQHQHGTPARRRYHDKEWGDKMEAIGLMPSATGVPGGKKTGDKMADYPIEGGRFLEVCRGLLTRDFQISWYDRFVAYHPGGRATGAAAPGMLAGLPPEGPRSRRSAASTWRRRRSAPRPAARRTRATGPSIPAAARSRPACGASRA
ncbi:hypothetical protein [Massilia scottii]|uniref:hypothetical protein n=1 Tax=Massilia scottii TaxID=3057166 RepID=UPI0035B5D58A